MTARPAHHVEFPPMTIPAFWTRFLMIIGIAKAAIAGAGLAIAVMGAFDIAAAAVAKDFLDHMRPQFLDYAAISGGVTGAAWAVVRKTIFS